MKRRLFAIYDFEANQDTLNIDKKDGRPMRDGCYKQSPASQQNV